MKAAIIAGCVSLSVLSASAAHARPQVTVGKPKVIVTHFKIEMEPPSKYLVPYEGNLEIQYFSDYKTLLDACPHSLDGASTGSTISACTKPSINHKTCTIYVLTEETQKRISANLARTLRHELAHCNGWYHPVATKQFLEGDIWPEAEGAKWVRSSIKVPMPKFPASTRILPASPPVVCVTPDWKQEPCSDRKYKDEPNAWAKAVRTVPYITNGKTQ
jgi:hypothetical protein